MATPSLGTVTALTIGINTVCAISDGQLVCWGLADVTRQNFALTGIPCDIAAYSDLICAATSAGVQCFFSAGQLQSENNLEEQAVQCPYCGETFTVLVDCSVTEQSNIEDCQVCCQPILMDVSIEDEAISILARRDDE